MCIYRRRQLRLRLKWTMVLQQLLTTSLKNWRPPGRGENFYTTITSPNSDLCLSDVIGTGYYVYNVSCSVRCMFRVSQLEQKLFTLAESQTKGSSNLRFQVRAACDASTQHKTVCLLTKSANKLPKVFYVIKL